MDKALQDERTRIVDGINRIGSKSSDPTVHVYLQAIKALVWNSEADPIRLLDAEIKTYEDRYKTE